MIAATLPASAIVVAIAATTIPATLIMRRVGRARGFAMASVTAVAAALTAMAALRSQSFGLFLVAAMLFGINMAFTQQYRYAAAESVPAPMVPKAVSFVLIGAIGGIVRRRVVHFKAKNNGDQALLSLFCLSQ